jgi:DNA-binding transcriptional ArsR family regulator
MRNPCEDLPEEERLQQIAQLLAVAAIRYSRRQPREAKPSPPLASDVPVPIWDLVEDEVEKKILRFIHLKLSVEPAQIREALGISAMTLTRRLARLRQAGLIQVDGRKRSARYGLVADWSRN